MRLELTRHNCHHPLKVARLPIPPFLHQLRNSCEQCPEQDSNLHASRHTHLKRARLPIPPPGQSLIQRRAENETRTRDPNLGKVMLYQLSYFRNFRFRLLIFISCFPIADAKVVLFSKPPKLFRTFYNTFITLFHQIPHYQYKLELSFSYISRHTVSIIFISETLIYL